MNMYNYFDRKLDLYEILPQTLKIGVSFLSISTYINPNF